MFASLIRNIKVYLSLVAFLTLYSVPVKSQNTTIRFDPSLNAAINAAVAANGHWSIARPHWETETWTDPGTIFKNQELHIFQTIMADPSQSEAVAAALTNRYQTDIATHTNDPSAIVRFAYSSLMMVRLNPIDGPRGVGRLSSVINLLDGLPPMHNYELAKLYFCVSAENKSSFNRKLLGEKLLRREPTSVTIKQYLIPELWPGLVVADKTLALLCANDLVHQFPSSSSMQALLASVYYNAWLGQHHRTDGEAAIAAYRKTLGMVPAGAFRDYVEQVVREIQKNLG